MYLFLEAGTSIKVISPSYNDGASKVPMIRFGSGFSIYESRASSFANTRYLFEIES